MKFTVYQIDLSDDQYENSELRNLYLDCIMDPTLEVLAKARSFYKPVAKIDAVSFDHVFEIGNIGPEKSIKRIAPMRSVSVGDIIMREDGLTKFVKPHGFGVVPFSGE